jgi:hypothetical protein
MTDRKFRLIVNDEVGPSIEKIIDPPLVLMSGGVQLGALTGFRAAPDIGIDEYAHLGIDWGGDASVSVQQVVSVPLSRVDLNPSFMEVFAQQLAQSFDQGVVENLTVDPDPADPTAYRVRANVRLPPLRYISTSILLGSTQGMSMGAMVPQAVCSICSEQESEECSHHNHDPEDWEDLV